MRGAGPRGDVKALCLDAAGSSNSHTRPGGTDRHVCPCWHRSDVVPRSHTGVHGARQVAGPMGPVWIAFANSWGPTLSPEGQH